MEEIRTLDVRVLSKNKWYDHFLDNDEPNHEIALCLCSSLANEMIIAIQYLFIYSWNVQLRTVAEDYPAYKKFENIRCGDVLKIYYYNKELQSSDSFIRISPGWPDPIILFSANEEQIFKRPYSGTVILSLENVTKGEKIF